MLDVEKQYVLSAYAFIRRIGNRLVLQSPMMGSESRTVSPSVFQLFFRFTTPTRPVDLLASFSREQQEQLVVFLEWCVAHRVFVELSPEGETSETAGHLAHWEFHDLLFHAASRLGRNLGRIGGTYRLRGTVPSEPYARTPYSQASYVQLSKPDLTILRDEDVPLTRVLEERRSKRTATPLSFEALGHFLYRTCRLTHVSVHDGEAFAAKLYPSGGSLHPLEIYFVNHSCTGLGRGLFHYDAEHHAAAQLTPFDSEIKHLLDGVATSTGMQEYPSVLFEICARFRRTTWKYEGIGYRLILAELGGLYQTMYLVATAMRLSPCAVGSGDSDRLASILSNDYYMEGALGEFILSGAAQQA
jgi:SagB-type dehydrogenase family enzyme